MKKLKQRSPSARLVWWLAGPLSRPTRLAGQRCIQSMKPSSSTKTPTRKRCRSVVFCKVNQVNAGGVYIAGGFEQSQG